MLSIRSLKSARPQGFQAHLQAWRQEWRWWRKRNPNIIDIGSKIAIFVLGLGSALTPSPVPNQAGELQTDGLYGLVRHPVYSGIILAVLGAALRSGSPLTVVLVVAMIAFFSFKARWEERRLVERYPSYAAYAARTPRLVPWPGRSRRSVTPSEGIGERS